MHEGIGNSRTMLGWLARQGDPDPLAAAVAQHADMVFATCRRVLGNDAEAADVAQDTFLHFLKNAGRIRGSVGGWLHCAATNRAIDFLRRNAARRRREDAYVADAQSSVPARHLRRCFLPGGPLGIGAVVAALVRVRLTPVFPTPQLRPGIRSVAPVAAL